MSVRSCPDGISLAWVGRVALEVEMGARCDLVRVPTSVGLPVNPGLYRSLRVVRLAQAGILPDRAARAADLGDAALQPVEVAFPQVSPVTSQVMVVPELSTSITRPEL